ncbi:MAG: 50S ribosomal protein L29 [Thiotrichales bacterium]
MKASDFRAKTVADLESELTALMRERFNLRMQQGSGQSPRPHQFSRVRKDIARVMTVLNEKRRTGTSA